jgi:hypothetical protein
MKKHLLSLIFILATGTLFAKKVKFAVDMTGQIINPTGVHIIGDFQALAGLGADLDPATAPMAQEGLTEIYSIIVDIPAFRKYEYKIVNGNLSYEVEFVPDESRVGYNFNDNRWMYVDSLRNDTSFVGALLFSGNAPVGYNLIRYKVDMNNAPAIPSTGVHVGSSNNFFSPSEVRMYSFGDSIYEIINYFSVNNTTTNYRFFNGNTNGDAEVITGSCSVFGNREISSVKDTVLPIVCFSYCTDCNSTSVKDLSISSTKFIVYPNPAKGHFTIESSQNNLIETVSILNVTGQNIIEVLNINQQNFTLHNLSLSSGIYTARVLNQDKQAQYLKLIIE